MSGDSVVQLPPDGTGKSVYTVELTKTINGVPTTVEMEVATIADSTGSIVDDFRQTRRREEIAVLTQLNAHAISMARRHYERINLTDRRGNVERGTLR